MNITQVERRENELRARAKSIKARYDEYVAKGEPEWLGKSIDRDMAEWNIHWKAIEAERDKTEYGNAFMTKLGDNPAGLGTEPDVVTKKMTGAQLNPLAFSDESLKAMYKAFKNRQPMRIEAKGFSTVEDLLPAQLAPDVVAHQHEWRILDRLPMISINGPSYEFIRHNFAGDTGGPDIVAEGATKPEYVPDVTSDIATVVKIAMHTGISYETLADWPTWLGYVHTECFKLIMDKENQQLLYGTGSSGQIRGLFNTSGILTHDASADASPWTAIDSIEDSITQLRTGNALAEPNLFITHPSTWGAIRRIKTTTGAFVVGDPLREAPNTLWGIPVLVTTACTNGQGLLLDTRKFGTALLREGIVMHQGFANDDFVKNIARYVFEERLTLAVERPQAVLSITNLPTS